jgi:hypothetical protein
VNATPRLFSYVVEHDYGLSPNPTGGFCALAFCKYNTTGRKNVVELADKDDWVIGHRTEEPSRYAGHRAQGLQPATGLQTEVP